MSHSAHSTIDASAQLLGTIFDNMHRERGPAHYAAIFADEDSAKTVAHLVARLLDRQGVPLGADFAKSPFIEGLELVTAPAVPPVDVSMPAGDDATMGSPSGSGGDDEEEPVKN